MDGFCRQAGHSSHGLISATPLDLKSPVLRVTTATPVNQSGRSDQRITFIGSIGRMQVRASQGYGIDGQDSGIKGGHHMTFEPGPQHFPLSRVTALDAQDSGFQFVERNRRYDMRGAMTLLAQATTFASAWGLRSSEITWVSSRYIKKGPRVDG